MKSLKNILINKLEKAKKKRTKRMRIKFERKTDKNDEI
jgi:hypothetical protein